MKLKDMKQWEQIEACIPHWEAAVLNNGRNKEGRRLTCYDCPLCAANVEFLNCTEGCVIAKFTGENECHGTPYYEYKVEPCAETAQDMADWLKDVRYKLFRLDR